MPPRAKQDPRVDKRRVTMRSVMLQGYDSDGKPVLADHEAVDYVRPDFLDVYVADAREKWQYVEVSEEPDAGPLGYDGPTTVPAHLKHDLAGVHFPATPGSEAERLLAEAAEAAEV